MRNKNVKSSRPSSQKAADVMQQVSSGGIIGNGLMQAVSDGTVRKMSDEEFDKNEEEIINNDNPVAGKAEEMEAALVEAERVKEEMATSFKEMDIRPWGIYILVQPFAQNPFNRVTKMKNGFIVPEFDPSYKSPDTGEMEEMQRVSIFARVMEVSPDTVGIKPGDIVMYNKFESVPIPFYGKPLEAVAWTHIKCVIGEREELEERWKTLSEAKRQ